MKLPMLLYFSQSHTTKSCHSLNYIRDIEILLTTIVFENLSKKDYKRNYDPDSPKTARIQYFKVYDLILQDNLDTVPDINDVFMNRLLKLENSSEDPAKIHFSGEFDSNYSLSNYLTYYFLVLLLKNVIFARVILHLIRFQVDRNPMYNYAAELIEENKDPRI